MVDQASGQANRSRAPYLQDVLKVATAPKRLSSAILRERYQGSNLSSAQIGEEFGLSKQAVLSRLRNSGVHKSSGRGRAKDNYRFPNPAYGYRVRSGRLESNPFEMKIARLIVELRDRQGRSFGEIALELCRRKTVTRQGVQWNRYAVSRVYRLWVGKL